MSIFKKERRLIKKDIELMIIVIMITSLLFIISGCDISSMKEISNESQLSRSLTMIDAYQYLPTFRFDGTDWWDTGEQNFPQSFTFNTTQDGNGDSSIDTDDALENLVRFKIGNNIYGTGRTGLSNRGPNDQRPAVYFHTANCGIYTVYEYWFYYADNDWLNDHEHDWERYFIYLQDGSPQYIKLGWHNNFVTYSWNSFPKDNAHPKIKVDGGSHAMSDGDEDGVQIRYNGSIDKRGGRLDAGNGQTIPWIIYSNDTDVENAVSYTESPDIFNGGDPVYSTNSNEYGGGIDAPWTRSDWDNPPSP